MPRFPRLVVPGYPHHVTQRGSRRQQTFFSNDDYTEYSRLLAELAPRVGVEILAYCLMPNHVHMILVPKQENSLAVLLRQAHGRYAKHVNQRFDWQGHLWQERFRSFVMDEDHLLAAARYVELNPVRARLCSRAADWPWSSVHYHLHGRPDRLITTGGMRKYVDDWQGYLDEATLDARTPTLRKHSRSGLPAGSKSFIRDLEALAGRRLTLRRPGRKPAKKL